MNRGWFTIIGGLGIMLSILLPTIPIPAEWHAFADKVPSAISAFLTYLGWQAYGLTPDGGKVPLKSEAPLPPQVVVVPVAATKPVDEPLIKP